MNIEFSVEGMTCTGFENAIKGNIGKLDGIVSVEASYLDKYTRVTHDTTRITPEDISRAIATAGYSVTVQQEK